MEYCPSHPRILKHNSQERAAARCGGPPFPLSSIYRAMRRINILISLALAVTMAGCVMDDIPCDCPGHEPGPDPTEDSYTIHFRYTGDGTDDLLAEKLEKVDLHVFGGNGTFVLSREVTGTALTRDRSVTITLPAGKGYTAVCIGNALQNTATSPTEDKRPDGIFISHPAYQSGEGAITTNDRHYYGTTALNPGEDNTVVFHSAHIRAYVEVLGYHGYLERNGLADNGPLQLCMKNLCPRMFLDGSLCPTRADYYPETTTEADKEEKDRYVSRFNILRLDRNHPAELHVYTAEGVEIHTVDIGEFVAANPGVDLTREEAELPILIDLRGKSVDVGIAVPDWNIEDVDPDMGGR